MKTEKELMCFARSIRSLTCEMFIKRGDGHIGGAFSIIETLSLLFGKYIRDDQVKDWFVLSKGHAGPSYYATLCLLGKIPRSEICTLNENGTILPSHPDRNRTPGVDVTTGSLGQGISEAVGIAYGLKLQQKEGNVYCIVGDGECNEGQVWEALQFASNKHLDNLVIFIDDNKKQVDGMTSEVSFSFQFQALCSTMGFYTQEIDGNNMDEIDHAIHQALHQYDHANVIIMNTVKGYGIEYFEHKKNCHHITFKDEDIAELQAYVDAAKELKL